MLELNGSINECKKSIIGTDTYIVAGMDLSAALSNKNVTSKYSLTVSLLYTETLGLGITSVLSRTYALLVGEEL